MYICLQICVQMFKNKYGYMGFIETHLLPHLYYHSSPSFNPCHPLYPSPPISSTQFPLSHYHFPHPISHSPCTFTSLLPHNLFFHPFLSLLRLFPTLFPLSLSPPLLYLFPTTKYTLLSYLTPSPSPSRFTTVPSTPFTILHYKQPTIHH